MADNSSGHPWPLKQNGVKHKRKSRKICCSVQRASKDCVDSLTVPSRENHEGHGKRGLDKKNALFTEQKSPCSELFEHMTVNWHSYSKTSSSSLKCPTTWGDGLQFITHSAGDRERHLDCSIWKGWTTELKGMVILYWPLSLLLHSSSYCMSLLYCHRYRWCWTRSGCHPTNAPTP